MNHCRGTLQAAEDMLTDGKRQWKTIAWLSDKQMG